MTSLEADKLKAEINLMLAQMYEINEKMKQMSAETHKTNIEAEKVEIETAKILKETVFYPYAFAVGALTAVGIILGAIIKIFF